MKKLMIAAAIVCAAAYANAASIAWGFGSDDTVAPDGAYFGEGKYADATAFLVLGTVSAGATGWQFSDGATILASANMDPNNWNWGATDVSSTAGMLTAEANAGDAVTLVLLDGIVDGTMEAFKAYEGNYIIGTESALVSATIPGTTPTPYLAAIDNVAYGAGDWTAVPTPEPTSGLLLLLGVAGLALRRRRA